MALFNIQFTPKIFPQTLTNSKLSKFHIHISRSNPYKTLLLNRSCILTTPVSSLDICQSSRNLIFISLHVPVFIWEQAEILTKHENTMYEIKTRGFIETVIYIHLCVATSLYYVPM